MASLIPDVGKGPILEPSGGDGAFVRALLEMGVPPALIDVWDVNADALTPIGELGVNIDVRDSLLDTHFRQPGKRYHAVIGNPPYLSKGSSYIRRNRDRLRQRFPEISAAEAYGMFLFMGANLLRPGGHLAFIISDTYRTLNSHERLRRWLVANFTIHQIAIMPPDLFRDRGAHVRTSVIHLEATPPGDEHEVLLNDCSNLEVGQYSGTKHRIPQSRLATGPGATFQVAAQADIDEALRAAHPSLLSILEGGIGLHTKNNARFIARIRYPNEKAVATRRIPQEVSAEAVRRPDSQWRVLHKRGGMLEYYSPPRHAIRWHEEAVATYMAPRSFWDHADRQKPPIVVSGVARALSARLGESGAVWNSNKAFAFFPVDPERFPAAFLVGLLNSEPYRQMMNVINHTTSMQLRDLEKLPLLPFTDEERFTIADLTHGLIEQARAGGSLNQQAMAAIDQIVWQRIRNR